MEGKSKEVKVLVVDDVEVKLIILEEIIKNMGFEAMTATCVKDAFQMMQENQTFSFPAQLGHFFAHFGAYCVVKRHYNAAAD